MEIKDGIVKLGYVFDSDFGKESDFLENEWDRYDGDDFVYELDKEDAKRTIVKIYLKNSKLDLDIEDVVELLDEMDYNGDIDWNKIIDRSSDWLKDYYLKEAMDWFMENNG